LTLKRCGLGQDRQQDALDVETEVLRDLEKQHRDAEATVSEQS